EAELVWAARSGHAGNNTINPSLALGLGWHRRNTDQPQPIGRLGMNPWGLYDLFGNMTEWCQDWFAPLPSGTHADWAGPPQSPGGARTTFGQSYLAVGFGYHFHLSRDQFPPDDAAAYLGFRVARSTGE